MKDSITFVKKLFEQYFDFFKGTLDADSLFDNILLAETIDTSTNTLLEHAERLQGLFKTKLVIQKSLFCFQQRPTMGLPFVSTLVTAFLVTYLIF